jgi:ParB/RepB/Spo0J family partition protein
MPPRRRGQAVIEKRNKALERLQIAYVPVGSIHPNSYNPNRQSEHEFQLLCRSIEEDGFTQPVIVAEDGETIVDGEHRWRAAQHLGHPEVPIVVVPMETAQAKIATLRHNRARGSEDIEMATDVLRDLERLGALDWAADSLDLSDTELQRLLDDIPAPEALAGEEFGEAWVPGQPHGSGEMPGNVFADATTAGASAAKRHEDRLKEAKTEQERTAVRDSKDVFRLSLVFSGDEAGVVRAGLGDRPADRVLAWCRSGGA